METCTKITSPFLSFVGNSEAVAVPEITLILFDLNGVLYHYDREARIAHLSRLSGLPSDAIRTVIWGSGFEDTGDVGALDASGYLREFGKCIGYDLTESEWLAAQRVALIPIKASLALLPRLRSQVSCAVLTNNNFLIRQHFEILYPEAAALVGERKYFSAEFGTRKPNPEAYRRCASRLGVDPIKTLFIDDSPSNVAGAVEAGMLAYEYTDPSDLSSEFLRRGLLT